MIKYLIVIGILFISGCTCNKVCVDCQILDEESCECFDDFNCLCSDGIQNGNEEGIDCGGPDCIPCFDCLTTYCSLISGATSTETVTSKKWNYIGDESYRTYYSNGYYVEYNQGSDLNWCTWHGSWKFDNPDSPSSISINFSEGLPCTGWATSYSIKVVSLEVDTLILKYGDRGADWVYIPETP
jgi:hypothetical protein